MGYDVDKSIATVDSTVNLAIATNMELAETTSILTSIMSAFGSSVEEAAHITDVLAITASNSNTNVSELGEAFKNVAPTASALGYTVEDVSAVLGIMANNAISGGEAGNGLKSILASLVKPTADAQQVMDDYGISLTTTEGKAKPLLEVVADMREKFGDLDETEQTLIATTLAGKLQMSKFLAIINGSDEGFDKLTEAIDNCDGATAQMKETMEATTSGTIKALKSKLEEMAIQIGEKLLPHLVNIVENISNCVDWFNNLDDGTQNLIIRLGLFGAALSPLSGFLGNVFTSSSKLVTKLGDLATKGVEARGGMDALQGGFSNVLMGIGSTGSGLIGGLASLATALAPFLIGGTLVVGVGLGLAGIVTGYQNLKKETEEASKGFDINAKLMQEGSDLLAEKVKSNLDDITAKMDVFITEGVTELSNAFNNVANDAEPNFESFKEMVGQQLADVKSKINSDTEEMVNALATFNNDASGKVVFTMESLQSLSDIHSENMFRGVEKAYEDMMYTIDNQGEIITGIMEQQGVDYETAYDIWEEQVLSDYKGFCDEMMLAQIGYQDESKNALEEFLREQSITNQESLTQAHTTIREGLAQNNEIARQAYEERAIAVAQADQEWLDQTDYTREQLYKINDLMYQEQQLINKKKEIEEHRTANEIAYIRDITSEEEYQKAKTHYAEMEELNQNSLDTITQMLKNASEDNTTTWEQAYDAMAKASQDGYDDSVVYTQEFWNKLNQYFSKGGTDINEAIAYAMDGMTGKVETSVDKAIQDAQNLASNFSGAMGGIQTTTKDMGNTVSTTTKNVSADFSRMQQKLKADGESIQKQNAAITGSINEIPDSKTIKLKSEADTSGITTMKNSLNNLWSTARNTLSSVGSVISSSLSSSRSIGDVAPDTTPNSGYSPYTARPSMPDTAIITTYSDGAISPYATRNSIASQMISSAVYNYNTTTKGIKPTNNHSNTQSNEQQNRPIEINLNIETFENNRGQDIQQLMKEISYYMETNKKRW